jgi:two-component system NtrC family sensor kinase
VVTDHLTRPFFVLGNEMLLQHVFINLFLNAIDAMPDGGSLAVSATRATGQVAVSVSDTGCGIPAEEVTRIFDPFFTRATKTAPGLDCRFATRSSSSIVAQSRSAVSRAAAATS